MCSPMLSVDVSIDVGSVVASIFKITVHANDPEVELRTRTDTATPWRCAISRLGVGRNLYGSPTAGVRRQEKLLHTFVAIIDNEDVPM